MIKKEIIVEKRKKLHTFLQDFGFSFADVNKMLRNKDVKVNGKIERDNIVLDSQDQVTFFYVEEMLQKKFDVIFENENAFVIYKHAGIESDGEHGLSEVLKAIAVHRLDRNTEGLMVFAKNEKAAGKLKLAFKEEKVHKTYLAEVIGCFQTEKIYHAFLVKDSEQSIVKIFQNKTKNSKPIATKIKTLKANAESSFLEIELLTGKTHQIRAHLAFLGHAVIGDGKYGKNENNKKFQQKRQKLACFKLKFDFIGIEGLDFVEFKKFPKWFYFEK